MARKKSVFRAGWLLAFPLSIAYVGVIVLGAPFLVKLSVSPPWGWAMLIALLYFALAGLSVLTHLWGIRLRTKILFIPF
jgi:hypothetical protein